MKVSATQIQNTWRKADLSSEETFQELVVVIDESTSEKNSGSLKVELNIFTYFK